MEIASDVLEGDVTRIRLSGRMDIQGTQSIETKLAAFLAKDGALAILDFAQVTFLASIGVRAILMSAKALQQRGGKVAILDPVPEVAKVLSLTGVDSLVPVCSGLAAARSALAPS